MTKNNAISDNLLEGVSGGAGGGDDAQVNGKCPEMIGRKELK